MKERILGVDVHCVTMGSAVAMGLELLDTPGTHRCYTPNPKLLSMAREDEGLRNILNGADLSLPDGVGVLLAARLTGKSLTERVAGADFALALAKAAGERHKSVYLLGGAPGVAERAGEKLQKACPGLVLAGTAVSQAGAVDRPVRRADRGRTAGGAGGYPGRAGRGYKTGAEAGTAAGPGMAVAGAMPAPAHERTVAAAGLSGSCRERKERGQWQGS